MAKPKENPLFEEPEFDEKEYLLIERERAKGILVIFVIGALSGIFAGYLQLLGYTYLAILLMLAILILLTRILKTLGIGISDRTSHRVINYGTYVLTWLLFWIIFLNPPLHVVSSPQIQTISAQPPSSSQYVPLTLSSSDTYQLTPGTSHFSIYLTYKYDFNITSLNYQQSSSTTQTPIQYLFSNNYLNFTTPSTLSTATGHTYDILIGWNSSVRQTTQPLTFTITYG